MNIKPKILMIYIEPTPYILGLINIITTHYPDQIDVLFLNENISQNWGMSLNPKYQLLSKVSSNKIFFYY